MTAEKNEYFYSETILLRDSRTGAGRIKGGADIDESYTSHHTKLLSVDGVVRKILTTEYVQEAMALAGLQQENRRENKAL